MEKIKSKVYVLTDEQGRIVRCEGGYTMHNIANVVEWVLIDEGLGDKFNLCQSHYFPDGLYTDDGIPRYKLADITPVLRSDEEVEVDRKIVSDSSLSTQQDNYITWDELSPAITDGVNSI